jgi:hypothetical protein
MCLSLELLCTGTNQKRDNPSLLLNPQFLAKLTDKNIVHLVEFLTATIVVVIVVVVACGAQQFFPK